jgi:hypothetical protein
MLGSGQETHTRLQWCKSDLPVTIRRTSRVSAKEECDATGAPTETPPTCSPDTPRCMNKQGRRNVHPSGMPTNAKGMHRCILPWNFQVPPTLHCLHKCCSDTAGNTTKKQGYHKGTEQDRAARDTTLKTTERSRFNETYRLDGHDQHTSKPIELALPTKARKRQHAFKSATRTLSWYLFRHRSQQT